MGKFYNSEGQVVEVDDEVARAHDWAPVGEAAQFQTNVADAADARKNARGAVGTLQAALTGFTSGATLGLSDVLIANTFSEGDRETLAGEIDAHPTARLGGEITGMVGSAFAGGSTPAGYLSKQTNKAFDVGRAVGGVRGNLAALAAVGTEGAIQNAGQYIGHAALEDREVTAEGLAGATGTGFAFGTAGGVAAMGIQKGTIAARRMFSKVMGSGEDAAATAAANWTKTSDEVMEAHTATADVARKRLQDITTATDEANIAAQNAAVAVKQEQAFAARAGQGKKAPISTPEAPVDIPKSVPGSGLVDDLLPKGSFADGMVSGRKVAPMPEPPAAMVGADFDSRMANMISDAQEPGLVGAQRAFFDAGTPTAAGAMTDLESQLAGTKALIDGGNDIGTVGASVRNTFVDAVHTAADKAQKFGNSKAFISSVYNNMDAAFKPGSLDEFKKLIDVERKAGTIKMGRADLVAAMDSKLVAASETKVAGADFHFIQTKPAVLGKAMAKEAADLTRVLEEFESAKAALTSHLQKPSAALTTIEKRLGGVRSGDGLVQTPLEPGDVQKLRESAGTQVKTPRKMLKELDAAHETALMKADNAVDETSRAAAMKEAEAIEQQLSHSALPDDLIGDVAKATKDFARFEKAAADLADAVGEGAHPITMEAASMYRKASDDAVRKTMDRTMRAAEDADTFGPAYASPKERMNYAKANKADAEAAHGKLQTEQFEAQKAYDAAKQTLGDAKRAMPKPAKASKTKGGDGMALLGLNELADIPGMPKASDLPVIGPLLSAWLKYRTVKAAWGKFTGRVPATADAKAASLAARTKDRIAVSVDRMLGSVEHGAAVARRPISTVAVALSRRIYDDGEPDADPKASLQQKAAVRIREITNYVGTPGAIANDVRRELRDVSDPDLIAAAEKHREAMLNYALEKAPKIPAQNPLVKTPWEPSPAASMDLARRLEVINDPASVYEAVHSMSLSLAAAETLRACYPKLFALGQERLMTQAAKISATVPYPQRVQMSLLFDVPLDDSLDPENMKIVQDACYAPPPAPPVDATGAPVMPSTPPVPSIAGDVNMSALHQVAPDAGSQRRSQ